MNCHSLRAVLDLLEEGRLSPRREAAARAHLASCADCRARAERPAAPAAPAAPESLKARLRAAARAVPAAAPGPRRLPLWPSEGPALALAAVALILVGAWIAVAGVPSQAPAGTLTAYSEEP